MVDVIHGLHEAPAPNGNVKYTTFPNRSTGGATIPRVVLDLGHAKASVPKMSSAVGRQLQQSKGHFARKGDALAIAFAES